MADENTFGWSSPILQGMRDANPELLGNQSDPVIAEFIWNKEIVNKGREEDFDKDDFFQSLGTLRNDINFWDSLGRSISRAWYTLSDNLDLADKYIRDATGVVGEALVNTDEEFAERFVARDEARRRNSPSLNQMNRLQAIVDEDADLVDMITNAADPNLILSLLSESLVQYSPTLLAALGTQVVTKSNALTSLVAGIISSATMTGSAMMEYLREEEGVKTAEDYIKAWNDPKVMNRAFERGYKYGVPIGSLDAISFSMAGNLNRIFNQVNQTVKGAAKTAGRLGDEVKAAGRVSNAVNNAMIKKSATRNFSRKAGIVGAEAGTQSGLGALGETLGSLWSTGKINQGEVFLEGILEPAILPFEIAAKSPKTAANAIKRISTNRDAGITSEDDVKNMRDSMDRRRKETEKLKKNYTAPVSPSDYGLIYNQINLEGASQGDVINTQEMDPTVRQRLVGQGILRKARQKNRGKFDYEFTEGGASLYNTEIVPRAKRQGTQGEGVVLVDSEGRPTLRSTPEDTRQQVLWDDLDDQRKKDFGSVLEEVTTTEDPVLQVDVENLNRIEADENLTEAEKAAQTLKYLTGRIRQESTTKAGKPRKKFGRGQASRLAILRDMQDNLSGTVSEQVVVEPIAEEQLKLPLRKKQKPLRKGPKNRAKIETFVNDVEDRRDNVAELRSYFERIVRNRKIGARDPRRILARGALDRIRSEDAGIQPETINLTPEQENTLRDVLDKARLDEEIKDRMLLEYGKSHNLRRSAKSKFENEDAREKEYRKRIFDNIENDKDTVRRMPDDKQVVETRERSSLELEQAQELLGEELWNKLVIEEWENEQAKFPFRNPRETHTQAILNAFDRVAAIRKQIYDLNIEVANDIVNETAMQNYEHGENSPGSLSNEEQKELLGFIQNMLGRSVSVIFDTVNSMTETVRRNQGIPKNIVVQGYANPLDKTIVLALDREFSKQVAGEEAFHIAMRIALNEQELGVLEGYDWVDIARQNDIDVSNYPVDLQAFEAVAKVFSKYVTGEKVKGLSPANKGLLSAVKSFLDKLGNFIRGKGWKKRYPTPIDIFDSLSRGDLANREFHYPVGPVAENFFDLNQRELEDIGSTQRAEEKAGNHWNSFGLLNRLLEHPAKLAAKSPWFRPLFAVMDMMRRYQDWKVHEGLTLMRPYFNAPLKVQREVEKFAHLLDFEAQGRNPQQMAELVIDNENQDAPIIGFQIPLTEDAQELSDSQHKVKKYEFAMGDTINGQKIEPGALIELTEEQTKAYRGYKAGADYRRNMVRDAILIKIAELSEGETKKDLEEKILFTEAKLAEVLDTIEEEAVEKELNRLKNAKSMLNELEGNPFYMPRMRKGDKQIIVREKKFDENGNEIKGEYGKIQHLEVDSKRTAELKGTFNKLLQQRRAELQEIWGDRFDVRIDDFSVSEKLNEAMAAAKEGKDFVVVSGMSMLELVMNELSIEANDPVKGALQTLKKELERKPIQGLGEVRQAQNITGHWRPGIDGYASIVSKKQLHTLSYQLGKILFEPELEKELAYLEKRKKESNDIDSPYYNPKTVETIKAVQKYFNKYENFVNDPVNRGAAVRNIVFHMAIGGRLSSAILNWMQLPQALWPLLCAINPGSFGIATPFMIAKNTALMAKAFADANRVALHAGFRGPITAYNLKLELNAPESFLGLGLKDESEWQLIRELAPSGVLSPVNMEDLSDNVNLKGLFREGSLKAKGLGTTLNFLSGASSYMFAYTEFTNRLTTALVIHRLAKDPKHGAQVRANLNRVKEQSYFKDSERLSNVELGDNDAGYRNAAHIAVVESQYMMGKFNRPQLFYLGSEGKGALAGLFPIATQFMSFPFQYLEMYFKNIRRITKGKSGAERAIGLQSAALITLAMVGLAGSFGLPFMENLRRLLLVFSDLDLEKNMQEFLVDDLGWGAEATNLLTRGALFQYAGFEGKNRAGMGNMVDSSYLQGDVGAVFGPAGGMIEQLVHYTKEGIERGDPLMIARGIAPIGGVKDMFGFVDASKRGIRTRSGSLLIAPEDMTTGEYWTKFVGFYPSRAALRRDALAYSILERGVGQRRRDIEVGRLLKLRRDISRETDFKEKIEMQDEFSSRLENYNSRALEKGWPPITSKLLGRRILAEINPTAAQMKTMPVNRRKDYRHSVDMLKYLEEGLR